VYRAITNFKLTVRPLQGGLHIPLVAKSITLGGRQSKVIVTDYAFGSSRVAYSTAQVLFAGVIDGRDVLFLHGTLSQEHEVALNLTGIPNPWYHTTSSAVARTQHAVVGTVISFNAGIEGVLTIYDSDTQLILYADSSTAATFWSPVLAGPSSDPFANFWGIGSNSSILIGGPYLVRSATMSGSGTELALRGDLRDGVMLTIIVPRSVRSITWNGGLISGEFGVLATGIFRGQLPLRTAVNGVQVPELKGWKFRDSLPEIRKDFDDKSWTVANHTWTNIPFKPYYGDGRVLYGCDYGL
jgi:hypothetical protein